MKVTFPINIGQRYYSIHFEYIKKSLIKAGAIMKFERIDPDSETCFYCFIDGKKVYFDISDGGHWNKSIESDNIKVFKLHYVTNDRWLKNVYPFPPISFYDWNEYDFLKRKMKYYASGKVFYNQRAYGNAEQRRKNTKKIVKKIVDVSLLDTRIRPQKEYFSMINEMATSLHVGGYEPCMLDRSQFQLMALGVCTISNYIPEEITYYQMFKTGVHYLQCDMESPEELMNQIEWVFKYPKLAIQIGNNAKKLFLETATPERIYKWIGHCLDCKWTSFRPGLFNI